MSIFELNQQHKPGSMSSSAPENSSFAISFLHLRLRREGKEDDMEAEEGHSRQGSMQAG